MFKHEMKEKREKLVKVDDLSPKAVTGLLEFIYTDTVPEITIRARELLYAAHKYEMPRLMMLCEEAMVSDLKIENAAGFPPAFWHVRRETLAQRSQTFRNNTLEGNEGHRRVERSDGS